MQGKLKRLQEYDIDLEAGSSKKLVTAASKQQEESPTQPEARQAAGDKPSFKVIGHFVMAMKRFQGIGRKLVVSDMALLLSFRLQGSKHISFCSFTESNLHIWQSSRGQHRVQRKLK